VTRALQQTYRALVTGDHSRSREWLDYVQETSRSAIR
jgi:ribosome modulation factor